MKRLVRSDASFSKHFKQFHSTNHFILFQVCKKCIVQYLEENTNCPICDTLLHQSHPLLYISHDRTLQTIVYKLVANLERDEIKRQVKYYTEQKLEFPPQLKEQLEKSFPDLIPNGVSLQTGTTSTDTPSGTSSGSTSTNNAENKQNSMNNNTTTASDPNVNYHRNDEQIALSLEPLEGLQVDYYYCFYLIMEYFCANEMRLLN